MASNSPWHRLYGLKGWKALRLAHLAKHPLCVMCKEEGRIKAANVCDHIVPHKGDEALFYDPTNLQGLCSHHHDSHKQSFERTGRMKPVIGLDGWPIDRTT